METVCILVGGKYDGKIVTITNIPKTLEIPVRLKVGYGVIKYINQHKNLDGKLVYRIKNYDGENL